VDWAQSEPQTHLEWVLDDVHGHRLAHMGVLVVIVLDQISLGLALVMGLGGLLGGLDDSRHGDELLVEGKERTYRDEGGFASSLGPLYHTRVTMGPGYFASGIPFLHTPWNPNHRAGRGTVEHQKQNHVTSRWLGARRSPGWGSHHEARDIGAAWFRIAKHPPGYPAKVCAGGSGLTTCVQPTRPRPASAKPLRRYKREPKWSECPVSPRFPPLLPRQ
jgi:hypothetical protein